MKKRIISIVAGCLIFCFLFSALTPVSDSFNGIYIDFSTATDEELAQAILDIQAEQRARLDTKIVFDQEELRIAVGKTQKVTANVIELPEDLTAAPFLWKSSDERIATCNNGTVIAKGEGTAYITCSSLLSDGTNIDAVLSVTVFIPVTSISVPQKEITVYQGKLALQEVSILPENATDQTFSIESSNLNVVAFDTRGKPVARDVGISTITISANDGSGTSVSYQVNVPNLNLELIKPESIITFGRYEQDNISNNGAEEIRWVVLARDGDKALIVSEQVLDVQQFNASSRGTSWSSCSLRRWLNSSFINTAFTPEEQKAIIQTRLTSTNDKVFLLSGEDLWNYFGDPSLSLAKTQYFATLTKYAGERFKKAQVEMGIRDGYYPSNNRGQGWWIRNTTTENGETFTYITSTVTTFSIYGIYDRSVSADYYLGGVRPAMWVDLIKGDLYIKS